MRKSKLMQIILIAGSALILIGVSLMWWMIANLNEDNVIEVALEPDQPQTIAFDNLSMVPGEECEYTVQLKRAGADQYDLSLNFVEVEEKTLKHFVRVKILSNGEVICDELLETLFENNDIVLPVDFDAEMNTELKIVYYLPIEVGNEAKNAEAVFELLLTASNE